MDQSYPIYAFTRTNNARYSSVHVTFCGGWVHSLSKYFSGKDLTAVESVERMQQYCVKFVEKSHHLKRRGRKAFV